MKFLLDSQNLILLAAALVSGFMLLWPKLGRGSGDSALTPLQATQLINHHNATIVDVRDEKAYAAGSLANARHVPFAELKARVAELVRFKSRPVVVLCQTGQQSARAIAEFKAQGFEEAYVLAGGIAAWQQAGLPLVAPRDNRQPAREAPRKGKSDNRGKSSGNKPTPKVDAELAAANDAADVPEDVPDVTGAASNDAPAKAV